MATLVEAEPETVQKLHQKLVHEETGLPEKYRVLFSLRNVKGNLAHEALLTGMEQYEYWHSLQP